MVRRCPIPFTGLSFSCQCLCPTDLLKGLFRYIVHLADETQAILDLGPGVRSVDSRLLSG